jgi:LmbE family N-acetylglucosaminyl deacetylase
MRILIITAHPDDLEIGMGATLARLNREGHDIRVHVFSLSDTIDGNEGIKDEIIASLQGVYGVEFTVHDYTTMYFTERYQGIRNDIFKLKQSFNPDTVFCKSPNALHPDHRTIGEACESIFLECTIYGIEGIRDNHNQHVNKWVEVSADDMVHKHTALTKYVTQSQRHYFDEDLVESWAKFRGSQIGKRYAEGFEVIREVS